MMMVNNFLIAEKSVAEDHVLLIRNFVESLCCLIDLKYIRVERKWGFKGLGIYVNGIIAAYSQQIMAR